MSTTKGHTLALPLALGDDHGAKVIVDANGLVANEARIVAYVNAAQADIQAMREQVSRQRELLRRIRRALSEDDLVAGHAYGIDEIALCNEITDALQSVLNTPEARAALARRQEIGGKS